MPRIIAEYREEARKRIMEAGLEVLYEKGYAKTTMEGIARRLDVTKPALYRYFRDKDELIIESVKERQSEFLKITGSRDKRACPVCSWIDLFEQVLVPDPRVQSVYFEMISLTSRKEELGTFSSRQMEFWGADIGRQNREWQEKGVIRKDIDPDDLSLTLIALFNGMRMQIVLGIDLHRLRKAWISDLHLLFFDGQTPPVPCQECTRTKECGDRMNQ